MTNPRLIIAARVLATPGALEALSEARQEPAGFLDRHFAGDWGELGAEDRGSNDQALLDGSRILSAYRTLLGTRLWIITEAVDDSGRRAATTILLPEEY